MHSMPNVFHLLIVLAVLAAPPDPIWAEEAQVGQAQGDQGCVIRQVRYTAQLVESILSGGPGEPLEITIRLDPDTLPIGYFVSTNIRILSAPATPDVLPGFPKTTVICPEPGEYLLEVTPSLITRTSCVGVSACSLPEERVILRIEPLHP
jgi:hypothetical protein